MAKCAFLDILIVKILQVSSSWRNQKRRLVLKRKKGYLHETKYECFKTQHCVKVVPKHVLNYSGHCVLFTVTQW